MQTKIYHTSFVSYTAGHAADDEAIEWANGIDFTEIDISTQDIAYARHIGVADMGGVDVWYDYGADYYFFTDHYGEA